MKENQFISKDKSKKHSKRKQVQLSTKEIEQLMGIHRDTYRKVNGAWRRK